eukprot:CAMPEP_0197880242 /NCGR_PEP_ID=MMETSP1439-20131203/8122_1 /TAXON_ID=66791 /ORGANISM="Gonyaulax spinifera, Strain CCMP409" /LENGTH=123 /DNA_ID=CAMNT_0043499793 /DNA_START=287 /DNA_END=657 /DNA_ORIENTATION=-
MTQDELNVPHNVADHHVAAAVSEGGAAEVVDLAVRPSHAHVADDGDQPGDGRQGLPDDAAREALPADVYGIGLAVVRESPVASREAIASGSESSIVGAPTTRRDMAAPRGPTARSLGPKRRLE